MAKHFRLARTKSSTEPLLAMATVPAIDTKAPPTLIGKADLEAALTKAINASIKCAVDDRLNFIAKHLLAQLNGEALPAGNASGPSDKAQLQTEFNELAKKLSAVVNSAKNKPGWPLKAVADAIVAT